MCCGGKKNKCFKRFVRPDLRTAARSGSNHTIILPYQHRLSCYLKGESPHSGNFTVHFLYPLTVKNFPFFKSSHNFLIADFSTPFRTLFLFFRALRHRAVVFSPRMAAHRKCVVSKQVPVIVSTPRSGPQS